MPEPLFRAVADVHEDHVIVTAVGDLDLAAVPQLEEALEVAFHADNEVTRVVVDLAGVEFIDSSGLTSLIKSNRRAGAEGRTFALRAPSDRVVRTLELTQLGAVLAVE